MSDIYLRRAAAYVLSPFGKLECRTCRVGNKVNEGWYGSVTLRVPLTIDESTMPANTIFQIVILDDNDAFYSGPMVACRPNAGYGQSGPTAKLEFSDATMWALGQPGVSFDTFKATNSVAIANAIAAQATLVSRYPVTINGLPQWPIPLEEIKQSKPIEGLRRLGAVAGMDFVIDTTGTMTFVSANSVTGAPWPSQKVKDIQEFRDLSRRCTGLLVERQDPHTDINNPVIRFTQPGFYTGTLAHPLMNAGYHDLSNAGYIDKVGFWQGDPSGNGKLIAFFQNLDNFAPITVPLTGRWPATHYSLNVYLSATQVLSGQATDAAVQFYGTNYNTTLLQAGVGPPFRVRLGTTDWPHTKPWVEPLIPSQAFASARENPYIFQRNRDYHRFTAAHSRLWLTGSLGQVATPRVYGVNWGPFRVDAFEHILEASGRMNTILSGPSTTLMA